MSKRRFKRLEPVEPAITGHDAIHKLPKKFQDAVERQKLCDYISDLYSQAVNDPRKKQLNDRAAENRSFWDNNLREQTPEAIERGVPNSRVQIMKPRIAKRIAQLHGMLTSSDPMFQIQKLNGTDVIASMQSMLRQHLLNVDFVVKTYEAAEMAGIESEAIIRVFPFNEPNGLAGAGHVGHFVGPMPEVISPRHFIAFPLRSGGLRKTTIHGHFFDLLDYEIQQQQSLGIYLPSSYSAKPSGSDPHLSNESLMSKQSDKTVTSTKNNRCSSLVVKYPCDDGAVMVLLVDWIQSSKTLLRVVEWKHDIDIYYQCQLETSSDNLFAVNGPANDLQVEQKTADVLWQELLHAIALNNDPPIMDDSSERSKSVGKVHRYKRGERIPVVGERAVALKAGAPVNDLASMLNMVMSMSDSSANVASSLLGVTDADSKNETATRTQMKMTGFQLGGNKDAIIFSIGLKQVVRACMYWLLKQLDDWVEVYDDTLPGETSIYDGIRNEQSYIIGLSSSMGQNLPDTQIAAIRMLLETIGMLDDQTKSMVVPLMPELLKTIVNNLPLNNRQTLTEKLMSLLQVEQGEGQIADGTDGDAGGDSGVGGGQLDPAVLAGLQAIVGGNAGPPGDM